MPARHSVVLNALTACALTACIFTASHSALRADDPPASPASPAGPADQPAPPPDQPAPPGPPPDPAEVPLDPKATTKPAPVVASPDDLSDKHITNALDKGADYLLAQLTKDMATLKKLLDPNAAKNPRSMVYYSTDQLAGQISMSVYALLTIGRVTGDPRFRFNSKEMEEPIKFLLQMHTQYTYAVAFHASALALLPNRPEFRKPLTLDRNELLHGNHDGSYTYHTTEPPAVGAITRQFWGDNSNTQYGQLGTYTCEDAGLEVPIGYWEAVDHHWRSTQQPTGGWTYSNISYASPNAKAADFSTATMTAAGTASLFLAQDELDHSVNYNPIPDRSIEAGLKWLTAHYPIFSKTMPQNLYLAYAIERVALYGGVRTFGTKDWYREGAAAIINTQKPDGSFSAYGGFSASTSDCAYALLFLSRGLAPVACAKLQYNGPWNARSRDTARWVHWFDKQSERTLNWQNVSIDTDPDQWQNIPVLIITGHDDPKFTPEQIAKLKRYVQNGGLIFSSADEGNVPFTKAIEKKYAPALFDNLYEMRPLPAEHPAFTLSYQIDKTKLPHLTGLSNGVRDVWIHSQDDITGSWQSSSYARTQYFEVPANIYSYATGRMPREIHYDPITPPTPPEPVVTLNVARIIYNGNWDPEPAAWERFAATARQKHAAVIHAIPTKIADLDPAKTPIAHITGTTAFTLNHDDQAKIADFLAKGGSLIADAAGGNRAFANSFQAQIEPLFPKTIFVEIPASNPALTGNMPGGTPIQTLDPRSFTNAPQARNLPLAPLQILQDNKPVVILSPGDLTAGIANFKTWTIRGYSPDSAETLMFNALLYLATKPNPNPPPAAPAVPAVPAAPVATAPADPALPPAPPAGQ